MNAIQSFKKNPMLLLLTSCTLIILSVLWKSFPVLIFIAFSPLFALLDYSWRTKPASQLVLISSVLAACLYFLPVWGIVVNGLFMGLIMVALFAAYTIMQNVTEKRFNKLALVILVMGMEYIVLKFVIHKKPFFIADILQQKTTWVRWTAYTGYLGISLWIMLTNVLFYQAFIRSEKINLLLFILFILTIALPIVYSFNLTDNGVTKDEVIHLYSGDYEDLNNAYSRNGELISRTGGWVSILILIFTLVRAQTKKVAR
ncbi:MAG: hypothetical protein OEV74_08425 [Cyclobacteriaceae bacterium]|nr:hypothetical protein [Cyclobacteriaceae bacterium]MDH4296288.1 hypothetical protein [Cyclobacteriaceae bacterium]MDH5248652.1 hypothetical protein [Cyclobacteriaceae bacterium]